MKIIFDKSKPVEGRLNFVEEILGRLSRRVHKVSTAIITPHLISGCVSGKVRGEIVKILLFEGVVTKGLICLNARPKNPICIEVKVLNGSVGYTKSYYIDNIRASVDLDVATIDGSMLTVSVYPTVEDDKDPVNEVWLSMLWTPHVSKVKVESHLIDNLEKAADANLIKEEIDA